MGLLIEWPKDELPFREAGMGNDEVTLQVIKRALLERSSVDYVFVESQNVQVHCTRPVSK